ncbi:MAG: MBOAT family O-acyltransferase, partial [Vicinamibacterales bacterium]
MVFSSYLFIFYFLPIALTLYYVAPRRAQHLVLTSASYFFYGWANPLFVPLLLGSTAIDYLAGLVIGRYPAQTLPELAPAASTRRPRPARLALAASICSNLALLGFFKYFNFAAESMDALA